MSYYNPFPNKYNLLCPELNEIQQLPQYRCSGHAFFDQKNEAWFWNSFAKRPTNMQRVQTFQPRPRLGGKLSLLEALPAELIEAILDVLLDEEYRDGAIETVLLLGISSDRLWPTVLCRIHRDYHRAICPSWAGKKVGFHGSCSTLPDELLLGYGIQNVEYAKYRVRDFYYSMNPASAQPEQEWLENIKVLRSFDTGISGEEWNQIEQDLSQAYLYPQDRVWILRNLTTRQFVRSDKLGQPKAITPEVKVVEKTTTSRLSGLKKAWKSLTGKEGKEKQFVVPEAQVDEEIVCDKYGPLTLPQVFLILTCHSRLPNVPYPEMHFRFQQGPWAAHAFDIVTFEEHEASIQAQTEPQSAHGKMPVIEGAEAETVAWTDVSKDVFTDVTNVRKYILDFEDTTGITRITKTLRSKYDAAFWEEVKKTRAEHRAWAGQPEPAW